MSIFLLDPPLADEELSQAKDFRDPGADTVLALVLGSLLLSLFF